MSQINACLICGAPLIYSDEAKELTCAICHKKVFANASCENGHYICDDCHSGEGITAIVREALTTKDTDAIAIAKRMMAQPGVYMHGPEHHVLVGAALIAACHNCGWDGDLPTAIHTMAVRGKEVPGGACGLWGCCGAAISAGIAYSVLTHATPLSTGSWGEANELTGLCLTAIGKLGGPRCCKRDSYTAILSAIPFLREHLEIPLEEPHGVVCGDYPKNGECKGDACPYHPKGV